MEYEKPRNYFKDFIIAHFLCGGWEFSEWSWRIRVCFYLQ